MVSHIPYLAHGNRWDCKAETTSVIIRVLGREPSCRWELRSLTAGCAQFTGRKLVMVFKQGSPALGLPADASLESRVKRQWVTLLEFFIRLRRNWCLVSFEDRCARATGSCVPDTALLVMERALFTYPPGQGCSCFPSGWA